MRIFQVFDAHRRGQPVCALLRYDPETGRASMTIDPHALPERLPFLFAMFRERGQTQIGTTWTMRWVRERIPPSSRQNIGEILRANNMAEYDEIELLARTHGESSQDDFQVREVVEAEPGGDLEYAAMSLAHKGMNAQKACDCQGPEYPDPGVEAFLVETGAALARVRKRAGLTQAQLARRCGIDQGAISRIEAGKANPTLRTLYDLMQACGAKAAVIDSSEKTSMTDRRTLRSCVCG